MEPSGEHFSPLKTSMIEIQVNIDRYLFAMQYLKDKVVLDLGCGAGLGTYFYSMLAKKVYALDYDAVAIEEAKKYPYAPGKVEFLHLDLTNPEDRERIPEVDVCVALEILEHLEDPATVLKALPAKQLVFSLPLYSLEVSTWHKYAINEEADVRKLISPFYDISKYEEQRHKEADGRWIRGEGVRLIS